MATSRPAARLGDWASAATRIALIGDSTLDNVLWVGDDPSISEQLAAAVPGAAVANLAADGFTTADTLHGSEQVISVGMRGRGGKATHYEDGCDPIFFDDDGVFRPLRRAAALAPPPTHVVLSVGGNDVREILSDMRLLPQVVAGFMPKYRPIVEACVKVTPNVILMLQYRPSFHMDGGGYGVYQAIGSVPGPGDSVQKLNHLMETIYKPVLELAREKQLPVIDLPRTFDIYRDELYSHQIEPSAKGGEVIAALVRHVVTAGDTDVTGGALYAYAPCVPGAGRVTEEPVGASPWVIPHDPAAPAAASAGEGYADVQRLVAMGFDRARAEAALRRHGGRVEAAADELLSG